MADLTDRVYANALSSSGQHRASSTETPYTPRMSRTKIFLAAAAAVLLSVSLPAQYDAPLFQELRWRHIGPYRGGRTKAATGVPGQPNLFYIGAVNGGVWKSTDYGTTWTPIFDGQPTGSVGAIAVAPSNPAIIYVGSGEGLQRPDLSTGDGIYKSTDAGRTWAHLNLRDGQQIPQVIIDPKDPDRLFVAVLGHPYGPNEERGIFRSTDGGRSFQKVLYKGPDTGGADLAFDPSSANHVYAVLWQARLGPWENGVFNGPNSGLFESTDGGETWKPLTKGLPAFEQGLGRIGIAVSPSDPKRMYAAVQARTRGGLYRSDDAGQSWYKVTDDDLVVTRGDDFAEVKVHPKKPDIVFTASVVTWKSTDGGKTFTALRGAPGGDDYHRIWINPDQPTAQFYHVSADNAFPYRVCGGQQESGSACVQSRGDDGRITIREWHPVGVEEYGYVAPDPLNPDLVYGGKVSRYNRKTGEVVQVGPRTTRGAGYRTLRTQPLLFSPIDPHILYFASNTIWKTTSGGMLGWTAISQDLTRKTWDVPPTVGVYTNTPAAPVTQRGVVYTIAPGYTDLNRMWAGTDDGLIHVTADGGATWKDVTPPELKPWAKVSMIDASHTNPLGAYAAVNTIRLDDLRPYIYRTRDGGKTWTSITNGLPDGATINTVKEDPKRKGLLYAGSETQVYVSFDDGDRWQPLRNNMPATSIRDLVIKDDDLVVGTHGRGFWILDGIAALRQIKPEALAADALYRPGAAIRFEWNKNTDTPLPPDEPAGQNSPDGAIVDYYLSQPASSVVTLEVLDGAGRTLRRYASDDKAPDIHDEGNVPSYWIRPERVLPATAGLHRFVWDLHYPPPPGVRRSFPIAATPHETAPEPKGPWVVPGAYTLKLTADGKSHTQPLVVRMDPRVKSSPLALHRQFVLAKQLYDAIVKTQAALSGVTDPDRKKALSSLVEQLLPVYGLSQEGSGPPPVQTVAAARDALKAYGALMAQIR